MGFHQCCFKPIRDGYCKVHHPDTVKKRDEEARRRWEEKEKSSPLHLLFKAREEIQRLKAEVRRLKNQYEPKKLKRPR